MLVVVDTNIIVNALKSSDIHSKSMQLMNDLYNARHTMCVSSAIMEEYRDVLSRPQLGIDASVMRELISWIDENAYHIEPLPTSDARVEMKDEDDRIFFDVAKCLNARLVTRNYKDYPVHELITLIDELY